MNYAELTDAEWQTIKVLLPPQKSKTGRPAHDHRRIVSGILWVQRTDRSSNEGSVAQCLPPPGD